MRIDCALLCDAVTVREGLLHILGGGVTRLGREVFPGPLGVQLALRLMVHPTEVGVPHNLEVRFLGEDGQEHGRVEVQFGIESPGDIRPGEEHSVAIPLPVQSMPLPIPGAYTFEVLVDGVHGVSVPFVAVAAQSQERP